MAKEPIMCPYCFNTFADTQTVFRAKRAFEEIDRVIHDSDEAQVQALFAPYDEYEGDVGVVPDGLHVDRELVDFWALRGGVEGYRVDDPDWYLPHIDLSSPEAYKMVRTTPLGSVVPDKDGFVRDADGFAYRVIERYETMASEPMARLCPHCHNRLPLNDYGKYRTVFVGITGMTGSGKTVYLTQLLGSLHAYLKGTGYHLGASHLGVAQIKARESLPGATDISVMRRPKAINLIADDPADPSYTLVFYDIAGENCVDAYDDDPETLRRKESVASYLGHMDALIFLVDPVQLPYLSGGMGGLTTDVGELVTKAVNLRSNNVASSSWDRSPVAVVISKADLPEVRPRLEKAIGRRFEAVGSTDAQGMPYCGFPRDEYVPINTGLHEVFRTRIPDVEEKLSAFKTRGYFAVSALRQGVRTRIRMHSNTYLLSEEDAERVKAMRQWLSGWDKRSVEDRAYYDGGKPGQRVATCPIVRLSDGSALVMDIDKRSGEFSSVVTDIVASKLSEQGAGGFMDDGGQVNLTIADIISIPAESIAMDGQSLRIEEPLKWILWQLGIIAMPQPCVAQPTYPFLCSARRRREIDEEYQRERADVAERFYGCEE